MDEHEEDYEPLIEEGPLGKQPPDPTPPVGHALIRGCPHRREGPGRWAFWALGVGWQFHLAPRRGLWRRSVTVAGAGQVMCLDDAVLFALGYEEGLQDVARERREGPP